jgi:molybdopterin molybdotransferase
VAAAAVTSPVDLPLFRNSQMDGFAVRAGELPGTLPVVASIAAAPGEPAELMAGTAVRIMTGAPVPEGADAVVPIEDAVVESGTVTIDRHVRPGEFVRERGSDLREGDQLLPARVRLEPRHLAALAASGIARVPVLGQVRVAIITTGAELIGPEAERGPGQIYDSNGIALEALVVAAGALVHSRHRVTDDRVAFRAAMDAAAGADLIVTSGGISMGDHEVVRETLEPLGARVTTIAMQPGGPQATGLFEEVPVVCFPGNPVSTQLSFRVFLEPHLRRVAGLPHRPAERMPLAGPTASVVGKRQFLRGRRTEDGRVELVSGASSHLVAGYAAADVLIDVPLEVTELAADDVVEVWPL